MFVYPLIHLNFHLANENIVSNIYWNAEKKCRKFTKFLAVYMVMNQSTFLIPFLTSIYNIYVGNLDTSTWELTFKTAVPFSTEPIWGWYILYFFQFLMSLSYSMCMPATTSYFVSGCFYIEAVCKHFDALIDSLKGDIEPNVVTNGSKQIKVTQKMYGKFKEKLRNSIEVHMKSYE